MFLKILGTSAIMIRPDRLRASVNKKVLILALVVCLGVSTDAAFGMPHNVPKKHVRSYIDP